MKFRNWLKKLASQKGEFSIGGIISTIVSVVVLGAIVVGLWDTLAATDTSVQALMGTDAGTTTLQTMWPILLIVVGAGVAIGAVMWVLKETGIINK